jgi:hypothetical protein
MNPYQIAKINKQYDAQIAYLLKLIDMHSTTMITLQKQKTNEINELMAGSVCYDSSCCVNTSKCHDRIVNNNANFDDKLLEKQMNTIDPCGDNLDKQLLEKQPTNIIPCDDVELSNQELISESNKKLDKLISESNILLDKQLLEKQMDTIDPCGDNLDMGLSDQDLIWERIRSSQIEIEKKQLDIQRATRHGLSSITENINDDDEDNPHIIFKSNNLAHDLKMDQIKEPDNTPPRINALYKVNPTSRKAIIQDIFKEATESIKKLSELDEKYKDNFDNEVQKEADRLLEVYLKTH